MSIQKTDREEESEEKSQTYESDHGCNLRNIDNYNYQQRVYTQYDECEGNLQNMQNLTLRMIETLDQQKIQFEILYAGLKRILIRESEILKIQLNKQQAKFKESKKLKIFDNSLQQLLAEDRDCLRQDFQKLNEHLCIQGFQQKQIIEILDQINNRVTQIVSQDSEREQLYSIQEYKLLQTDQFRITHQIIMKGVVKQFATSKDWKYLAASQYQKAIVIWDLVDNIKISQYDYDKQVYSIRISDDNQEVYFGDESGLVSCLLFSNNISWQSQIHKKEVNYIQQKQKNQIITSSQDNRIILTDISQSQTIWVINYICPCFSGFDISENNQLIAAPNGRGFTIWNINNGQEISKCGYIIKEERFIQILFSYNMKQLLVGLGEQQIVLLLEIQYPEMQISIKKEILFEDPIKNISWCLNDNVILVNSRGCFQFRNASDFGIIKEFAIYEPYFLQQKQNHRAKKIILSHKFKVFIFERLQKEIDF